MQLGWLDALIFVVYFVGVVLFGVGVAAFRKARTSQSYFLASKGLPWYVVGASFITSNISTEHFIGMIGWAYLYGIAIAHWSWANVATFSMLIWIFLPFYLRGNVATMPEFLERRFNRSCRHIYAVVMLIGMVIALIGGVLYAGASAIHVFFPEVPVKAAILILAVAAGAYCIYGGLLSAVWADLLQYILLMAGGIIVACFGLHHVGGLSVLVEGLPEKFIMFFSAQHEMIPWTGLLMGTFSVGLWYSCANQFMVQRCLGARSDWDARMGVVMAGFSQALLPLIIVVPGIVALYLFHDQISNGDQSWPFLVQQFLPSGFVGLVLAGLASAILSTVAAITNSSATIFTLDLYQSILRPGATDRELLATGRISGLTVMAIGVGIAWITANLEGVTVFGLIQTVFFYVAPPIAAVFLVGIVWPRATPPAATASLLLGFLVYLPLSVFVLFPKIPALQPYDNFMHHTFAVFLMSVATLVLGSLVSRPKPREQLQGVVWTRSALASPKDEEKHTGWRSLKLWWALMVGVILALYAVVFSIGGGVRLFEAEKVKYEVSAGSQARLQRKTELEDFNLWTGLGQTLFVPSRDGEAITFELPISRPGDYTIAALVTKGPRYGRFGVEVNGQAVPIRRSTTTISTDGRNYRVVEEETMVFDASRVARLRGNGSRSNPNLPPDSIASDHLVQRIDLGRMRLPQGIARISLTARESSPGHRLVGVDQWIVKYLGEGVENH